MSATISSLFDFISDESFRSSLECDHAEMTKCLEAEAWKAVHVLAGSIVEAVLSDYCVAERLVSRQRALGLDLAKLIELAKEHGITSVRATDLSTVIRDYRNLIHPGRAIRLGEEVNADTARVAVSVVSIIISDVSKKRLENYGYTAEQIAAKLENDSSASAIIRHLLNETGERETERLLLVVLPERYLVLSEDDLAPEHALASFEHCFRTAASLANDVLKKRIADRFVSVLKEENDRAVFSYWTAFFRCSDIECMSPDEQTLVKDHLLSRLKTGATQRLLTAAAGIGAYLAEADVSSFVDPLVKLACSSSPIAEQARELLENEYVATPSELDPRIAKRLAAWADGYENRDQPDNAQIVREISVIYEAQDIPF